MTDNEFTLEKLQIKESITALEAEIKVLTHKLDPILKSVARHEHALYGNGSEGMMVTVAKVVQQHQQISKHIEEDVTVHEKQDKDIDELSKTVWKWGGGIMVVQVVVPVFLSLIILFLRTRT